MSAIYRHGRTVFTRGDTRRLTPQDRAQMAASLDIRRVIGVCPRSDPAWAPLGIEYLHWPFADGRNIPNWLNERAEHLATQPGGTLIYCVAGRNRSILLAAATLRHLNGWTGAHAAEHVRQIRPGSLANQAFLDYLESLPKPRP